MLNEADEVYDNIDIQNLAILYLIFEGGFDNVTHGPVISKISQIGMKVKVLKLVEPYLHYKMQIVDINQSFSCPTLVTSGVPQDSTVCPLFFILFMNEIPDFLTKTPSFVYCDNKKIV